MVERKDKVAENGNIPVKYLKIVQKKNSAWVNCTFISGLLQHWLLEILC